MSLRPDSSRPGGHRVLLVEDHPDTRQMYAEFLGMNFQVTTAGDGEKALALLELQDVDAIVTDLSLPGIDGFELITRVRAKPTLRTIPIVCLSGYGGHEHEQRAHAAGSDRILQKPCMPDTLAEVVAEMIQHAATRRSNA